MSTVKVRLTKPGLQIDTSGVWHYQNNPIQNEGVLNYFKKQLRRDAKGYYIKNVFGELKEHGYLDEVSGFPLIVKEITPLPSAESIKTIAIRVRLDSQESLLLAGEALYILAPDTMVVAIPDRGNIPARLSPASMTSLTSYLYQDEKDDYFLVLPSTQRRQRLSRTNLAAFFQPAEQDSQQDKP